MDRHPIERLMGTSMENISGMIDVNTVIGDPVATQDGSTIIPISKVSFGFAAGGGEYASGSIQSSAGALPFAGGSGAGVSVQPMGFLVCSPSGVRLLRASYASPFERFAELLEQMLTGMKDEEEKGNTAQGTPCVRAAYQE